LILTVLVTLIVESTIAAVYALWRRKPLLAILCTSVGGNLITQAFLWLILHVFFSQYLVALFVAEIMIWMFEGLLLYFVPINQMQITQAMLLSFLMNSASLGLGWFLPL
jgi:hypothetical protein